MRRLAATVRTGQTGGSGAIFWFVRRLPTWRPKTGALVCDFFTSLLFFWLCRSLLARAEDRPDLVIADFEGMITALANRRGRLRTTPAHGTFANQMAVAGILRPRAGECYLGGDGTRGRSISPPFKIERPVSSIF